MLETLEIAAQAAAQALFCRKALTLQLNCGAHCKSFVAAAVPSASKAQLDPLQRTVWKAVLAKQAGTLLAAIVRVSAV